jgi:hypothetical protein
LQCVLPVALQPARDKPVLGLDLAVAALGPLGLVSGALDLQPPLFQRGVVIDLELLCCLQRAVHPVGIFDTNLARYMDPEQVAKLRAGAARSGTSTQRIDGAPVGFKTVAQGVGTSVLVAISPQLDGVGGRYFEDCNEVPIIGSTIGGITRFVQQPPRKARLRSRTDGVLRGGREVQALSSDRAALSRSASASEEHRRGAADFLLIVARRPLIAVSGSPQPAKAPDAGKSARR